MNIDLSVQIKRNAESQNYQLNMLVINPSNTGAMETNICQTLAEVCEKIAQFEAKHLLFVALSPSRFTHNPAAQRFLYCGRGRHPACRGVRC